MKAIFNCETVVELFGVYEKPNLLEQLRTTAKQDLQQQIDHYNKSVIWKVKSEDPVEDFEMDYQISCVEDEIEELKSELKARAEMIDQLESIIEDILDTIDKDQEEIFQHFVRKK